MQLVNLLDSAICFGQHNIASVFLSEDVGLTDAGAGYALALFTGATAICLFFSGAVPHRDGPAATWLWLGLYALIGCGGALLLRGWLTRGMVDRPPEASPAG
jgi:hypothetical protein